jgi:hypothetical protein
MQRGAGGRRVDRLLRRGALLAVAVILASGLVPAAADAGGPGAISGVVTDADGDPMANLVVYALPLGQPDDQWVAATTEIDGSYVIEKLLPGQHGVAFHVDRWECYDSRPTCNPYDAATWDPVMVTAGATTTGIDLVAADDDLRWGAISGHVTDANGEAFAHVEVWARRIGGGAADVWFRSTDSAGDFRLDLRPGAYNVHFIPPGIEPGECYDDLPALTFWEACSAGDVVSVQAAVDHGGFDAQLDDLPLLEFPDVNPTHPFWDGIAFAVGRELTTGFADGLFHGDRPVTRRAAAAFLYRFAEFDVAAEPCTEPPFPDVAVGSPLCGEIMWLQDEGLATGFADGTFRPNAPIERHAFLRMLYRLRFPERGGVDDPCVGAHQPGVRYFTDVGPNHPLCPLTLWGRYMSIVAGYTDGTFRPAAPLSRQAAVEWILQHYLRPEA